MEDMLMQILMVVTVLIPIVTGITAMVKLFIYGSPNDPQQAPPLLPPRYQAILPFIIGVIVGLAAFPLFDMPIWFFLWAGGLTGLAAGGFYSVQNIRNK